MIEGFTKHALVVYPHSTDYVGKNYDYKNNMDMSTRKLHTYLDKCGITYDCFITDDVARTVKEAPDRWVRSLLGGDMFFVKRNCVGFDREFKNEVTFDEIYSAVAEAVPVARGISTEARFERIITRDEKARKEICKKYNMIVLFKQGSNPAIKYTPKANSNVLYIEIDNTTFVAKCYMSNMVVDNIDILGFGNANMPVYEWEVD